METPPYNAIVGSHRVVVSGRVQGVGFRSFVANAARRLGLDGQVWNRADGSVEVRLGNAGDDSLADFLDSVRQGPGIVRDVVCTESDEDVEPGFRIVSAPD
jgi:acylphosphatase